MTPAEQAEEKRLQEFMNDTLEKLSNDRPEWITSAKSIGVGAVYAVRREDVSIFALVPSTIAPGFTELRAITKHNDMVVLSPGVDLSKPITEEKA